VPSVLIAAASSRSLPLGITTLVSWLITASIGAYMFRTLVSRGGLRRQRAVRHGLHPGVLFGHFTLALLGLGAWVSYLAAGVPALAWVAVLLVAPAIGLGICTVILWTPFPSPGEVPPPPSLLHPDRERGGSLQPRPGEGRMTIGISDETLASALTDDVLAARLVEEVIASLPADSSMASKKSRAHLAALVPAGHGIMALVTFALAVVTAAGTR
jgi:hypothetical protein